MRAWLWAHLRRSRYKKHSRLEGNGEPGEAEEEKEEEHRGAKAAVWEGHPSQPQPPSESPPDRGPAREGALEGPSKALAVPLPLAPLPSKDLPPADGQPPALTPPDAHQEILTLVRELEAVREFQSIHCQEQPGETENVETVGVMPNDTGKKDLRSCQECLKSLKAMQDNLQAVQSRLWWVEAKLGMRVPLPEEQEEEPEGEREALRLGTRSIAPPLG